jgi:Glyoxalase-like domain
MTYEFQLTVDCADPRVLADWWAETLGSVPESSDSAMIQKMIDHGYATDDDVTVYKGELRWKSLATIRHPDDPDHGPRRRMSFQAVPEPKTVKNRLHIDVNVGPEHIDAALEKLVNRGGQFLCLQQQGPESWVTMADPEGNEF